MTGKPASLDLDEIAARAAALYEYATVTDPQGRDALYELTDTDVPALLDEVRRLRDELAEVLRPNTPRLCKCGHSNLAHTVPAPHSCFAYGQTCPCPAYEQLPHDEAVAQLKRNQQVAAERAAEETHVVADDSDDPEHVDDCPGCQPTPAP